jgi:uncharacterized protein (TIGR02246 family)
LQSTTRSRSREWRKGISEIEGKVATGSDERERETSEFQAEANERRRKSARPNAPRVAARSAVGTVNQTKTEMKMRILNVMALAMCAWLISLPSEAQTNNGLSQTDLRKIDEATQTAMKAALAKDFATWAALFLDDAVVNPPNEPAVKGRAAIRAWLEKFPPITEFTLKNVKVEGREDLAYVLGTYTMTIVPPSAPGPVKDSGKFVTVVRRQADGRWLVAVDMFSSDMPAAPPPK